MRLRAVSRRLLLAATILLLLLLAWTAISGAVDQLSRARTTGQRIETGIQLLCGVLTVLVVVTRARPQRWRRALRLAWAASLIAAAGLSGLVWGPPMPVVALLLAAAAGGAAWAILRILDLPLP